MDFGCSSFSWETLDGRHLFGRTYDRCGDLKNTRILFIPRNHPQKLMPGDDKTSAGPYAFLCMATLDLGDPVIIDGVNEHGLAGALLNFPDCAVYPELPGRTAVYPGFLLGRLLSRCATVEEAADLSRTLCLQDPQVQGYPMEVHFLLTDPAGETIVLEPSPEGPVIHRRTIGVLANSPDYLWQRTHLRCYADIAPPSRSVSRIGNYELAPFSAHTGIGGRLPGGYDSPDRFARLAFVKEAVPKGKDETDGVNRMFRCFATVETPPGLLGSAECPFYTLCTTVMCLESRTYYFSPAADHRISALRLEPLLKDAESHSFTLPEEADIAYWN